MNPTNPLGQIVTFYSYKGGTGRSMAVANVGCLLAQGRNHRKKRVLLVDWDLEAPGLHRFFRDRFRGVPKSELNSRPGLLEIFKRLDSLISKSGPSREEPTTRTDSLLREAIPPNEFALKTGIEGLDFIKAGIFDDKYPQRVNTFQWARLFTRAPWVFTWFGNFLAELYQYVLIDSRTGVTDTSGICTTILPEKLVAVFTPNHQSLEGVLDLVRGATTYRRQSDDLRPLMIFPLPSRIEPSMEKLRRHWRFDPKVGYQPQFEDLIRRVYGIPRCDLTSYFDDIQIQQVPDYAYGEEIAVLDETSPGDRLSLARSYEAFVNRLVSNYAPWDSPSTEYPSVFISFSTKDQQFADRLNTDLVNIGIQTWFAPQDLNLADNIPRQVDDSIQSFDRLLLILSKDSVESKWVESEIETAFKREREENRLVLCPITIDSAAVDANRSWVSEVRRVRNIGDFTQWQNPDSYKNAFQRLLRDLRAPTNQ